MKNLFAFLWRYQFFFLFVLLEFFSLFLLIRNTYYQSSVIVNSTNRITGGILNVYSGITDYFSLKKANRILAEENADFYNKLPGSFIATDTNTFFLNDTLYRRQYRYFAAKVISNTTSRRNNYLMIDKGKVHGIEREMGVTASGGIVGQVVEVSDYFSTIMSVLNIHSRISVRVKSSGQIGTLIWNGKNYRIGTLIDIPTHSKLNVGDTIVTSGYSHIFPEGIQVGTVKDFRINPGDNFYTADISYFVDYNKIYHVFVIRNIFRKDQNKLDANKNKTP